MSDAVCTFTIKLHNSNGCCLGWYIFVPLSAAFLFVHQTGSCLTNFFISFFAWYRLLLFLTDIGARFHTLIASLTQDLCTTFDLPICMGLPLVSALVEMIWYDSLFILFSYNKYFYNKVNNCDVWFRMVKHGYLLKQLFLSLFSALFLLSIEIPAYTPVLSWLIIRRRRKKAAYPCNFLVCKNSVIFNSHQ